MTAAIADIVFIISKKIVKGIKGNNGQYVKSFRIWNSYENETATKTDTIDVIFCYYIKTD